MTNKVKMLLDVVNEVKKEAPEMFQTGTANWQKPK